MQFRRETRLSFVPCICRTDDFSSFFHLLLMCATPLSTFSILVKSHGLLGTPSSLELKNVERRSMARLAFNDVGLADLVGDVDAGQAADSARNGTV